jgi:hypothetical protein
MKLITRSPRRLILAGSVAAAAILLPAVALASSAGSDTTTSATQPHAAASPHCARSSLTSWIGLPGGATAGSTFYELEISNISYHACTLYGFPGVSALGAGGRQLGSASARTYGFPIKTVTLQPLATAHVYLQIADVSNFPRSACHPTTADTLRVYAPGDYASMKFPFTFQACARKGPVSLHVNPTLGGTGIPGYSN